MQPSADTSMNQSKPTHSKQVCAKQEGKKAADPGAGPKFPGLATLVPLAAGALASFSRRKDERNPMKKRMSIHQMWSPAGVARKSGTQKVSLLTPGSADKMWQ